jgi:hypothetical protein
MNELIEYLLLIFDSRNTHSENIFSRAIAPLPFYPGDRHLISRWLSDRHLTSEERAVAEQQRRSQLEVFLRSHGFDPDQLPE